MAWGSNFLKEQDMEEAWSGELRVKSRFREERGGLGKSASR
jgi:hypothetical protein